MASVHLYSANKPLIQSGDFLSNWLHRKRRMYTEVIGYPSVILSHNGKPTAAVIEWNLHSQIKYQCWECIRFNGCTVGATTCLQMSRMPLNDWCAFDYRSQFVIEVLFNDQTTKCIELVRSTRVCNWDLNIVLNDWHFPISISWLQGKWCVFMISNDIFHRRGKV